MAASGFLRKQSSSGVSAAEELRLHQAACVDSACFCRSEVHLHAHSEAHRARTQVDVWREKALLHQQHRAQKLRKAQQQQQQQQRLTAATGSPVLGPESANATPRMLPSVSEPSLAGMSQHDLDDSPYVDIHSVEQSALVTNTARVHPHPALALQGVSMSAIPSAVALTLTPASPERAVTVTLPTAPIVAASAGPVLSIPLSLIHI